MIILHQQIIQLQSKKMKTTIFRNVLCSIFILFSLSSESKSNQSYVGYILTEDGQTIKGKIKMLSPSLNQIRVSIIDKNGLKKTFKAEKIKEYAFTVKKWNHEEREYYFEDVVYIQKTVEKPPCIFGSKTVLLEREVTGRINMYHYFIERRSEVDTPYWHIIYIEKGNSGLIAVNNNNYKKVLSEVVSEYADLELLYENEDFSFNNLSEVLKRWNTFIANHQEEHVIYD